MVLIRKKYAFVSRWSDCGLLDGSVNEPMMYPSSVMSRHPPMA